MMKSSVQLPGRAIRQICFTLLVYVLLSSNVNAQTDSITDIQGNTYKIVAIGEQWWMSENLKVSQYTNGDDIPHIKVNADWANTTDGAYSYYDLNTENLEKYGNLYNWYTVNDDRGVCPEGWHVPSDEEWMTMEKYLGMSAEEADRMTAWRGTDEGEKLKSESFGGNNSSGFSALGTGYRDPEGVYKAMGTDNDYWTSTGYSSEGNTEGILHGFLNTNPKVVRNFHVPGYGFCVRCIRDHAVHVADQSEIDNTLVYPNPAGNQLLVKGDEGDVLTIQNIHGQTMLSVSITAAVHQVDLSGLEAGTYIVRLDGPGTTKTSSFIKM